MPEDNAFRDKRDFENPISGMLNDRLGRQMWALEQATGLLKAAIKAGARPATTTQAIAMICAMAGGFLVAIDSDDPWQCDEQTPLFVERGEGLGFGGQ